MKVVLPLEEMTLAEKLEVMETLWADISGEESTFSPPAWHEDVLRERERRAATGASSFSDWEIAKVEIRRAAHEDQDS
ncbi:MAG: addiction module protein [Verrucomicrobiota bacterium JB022]|nr:addiction module protein [Verrucomicrobiota bacterium JB022]